MWAEFNSQDDDDHPAADLAMIADGMVAALRDELPSPPTLFDLVARARIAAHLADLRPDGLPIDGALFDLVRAIFEFAGINCPVVARRSA